MTDFAPRTAVFDLDGTLADTSADLITAANACFIARGQPAPLDPLADAATAFAGGRAMLRLGHGRLDAADVPARVEADFPALIEHYRRNIDVHTTLYAGVVPALERLAVLGWRLAVCTNKPEALAVDLLDRLAILDRFGAVLGADTLPVRKPDPLHLTTTIDRVGGRVDRSVLIGDTVTDRKTAQAARVPCVLVTFGPEGRGVERLGPEGLLDHFDRVEAVLDRLVPDAR